MLFTGSNIPKNVDAEVIIWKCRVFSFDFYDQLKLSGNPITDRRYFCRSHFNGNYIINLKSTDRPYSTFNRPPSSVSPKKKKMSGTNVLEALSMTDDEKSSSESEEEPVKKPVQTKAKRPIPPKKSRNRVKVIVDDSSQSENEEIVQITQASSRTSSRTSSRASSRLSNRLSSSRASSRLSDKMPEKALPVKPQSPALLQKCQSPARTMKVLKGLEIDMVDITPSRSTRRSLFEEESDSRSKRSTRRRTDTTIEYNTKATKPARKPVKAETETKKKVLKTRTQRRTLR